MTLSVSLGFGGGGCAAHERVDPPGSASLGGRPAYDATDLHAFVSPDAPDTVTLLSG